MISFDDITREKIKEHDSSWLQIFNHPYWVLIIQGSGSGKTNVLLNLSGH